MIRRTVANMYTSIQVTTVSQKPVLLQLRPPPDNSDNTTDNKTRSNHSPAPSPSPHPNEPRASSIWSHARTQHEGNNKTKKTKNGKRFWESTRHSLSPISPAGADRRRHQTSAPNQSTFKNNINNNDNNNNRATVYQCTTLAHVHNSSWDITTAKRNRGNFFIRRPTPPPSPRLDAA